MLNTKGIWLCIFLKQISNVYFKTLQFLLGWQCKKHRKFCLINDSYNHYIITWHFKKAVTCGNPEQTNNEDPGGRWEERARFQCPQLKEFKKRRESLWLMKCLPLNEHVMNQTEARQRVQPQHKREEGGMSVVSLPQSLQLVAVLS